MVMSPLADARVLPSGLNATAKMTSVWPRRVAVFLANGYIPKPNVLSYPPEATILPLGLYATT